LKVLRTPDAAFADLTDYPFAPHYLEVEVPSAPPMRLHYLDEGPRHAAPILLLHGEPTWSYLYRKFVPPLAAAGHRVLAPDLIGFGKSDKPAEGADYSYERHVAWMSDWLTKLDLRDITLFCQDWGGLLGLRMVADDPDLFSCVVASNTFLPAGGTPSEAFLAWREFARSSPDFRIGALLDRATATPRSEAEIAAYDAPFPDEPSKAGARAPPLCAGGPTWGAPQRDKKT